MKFLAGMILFVAIIVAVLFYMNQVEEDARAAGRSPVAVRTAPVAVAPTPVPWVSPTPFPYVSSRPVAPVRPASQQARSNSGGAIAGNHRAAFDKIARQAGVTITSYSENAGSATIKVSWSSNNAAQGGDFLDLALHNGLMRDFDDLGKGGGHDRQGRQVWTGAYRIKF